MINTMIKLYGIFNEYEKTQCLKEVTISIEDKYALLHKMAEV